MKSRNLRSYLLKVVLMLQILLFFQFVPSTESRAVGKPSSYKKSILFGTKDSWQEVQLDVQESLHSDHSPGGKLTLEDAINRALKANRGLADAFDQVEGARLTIVSAEAEFELKIFPGAEVGITGASGEDSDDTIGVGISLQKRFAVGTDLSVRPNVQKTGDIYQTSIDTSLTQPLLRGFGREFNLSGLYGAEFGARSARRSLYLTQVSTVLATISSVYDVIRQKELVRLNEESAVRLRAHAEAAKAKEKIGLATQIDTYRAGIQQKQAEDSLNTAREAYRDALDNLKILLALPLEEEIEVEAPIPGIAVLPEGFRGGKKRKPRIGDVVWQGQPLVYLPDISEMVVKTQIREIDLHKVCPGKPTVVLVDAYPDLRLSGRVKSVGVLAESRAEAGMGDKYFQVMVSVKNGDERLRPGMTARVEIECAKVEDAVSVPVHAVFHEKGKTYCYVDADASYEKREVSIGAQSEDWAQVLTGLSMSDRVALSRPPHGEILGITALSRQEE